LSTEFLDLVEEDFALADGAGDHHSGQPGHGHLMDAARHVARLFDGVGTVDSALPGDGAAQHQDQHQGHQGRQALPDRNRGAAFHAT
jgi:hypothetical protein